MDHLQSPTNPLQDDLPLDFPLPNLNGVGSLLSSGFRLFFQNLGSIALMTALVWIPVELGIEYLIARSGQEGNAALNFKIGMWTELILGSLLIPAVIHSLWGRLRNGVPPNVGDSLKFGAGLWGRTFGYRWISGIPIAIGLLVLIVPGIIIWAMLAFIEIVLAVEGMGGVSNVFGRSRELTKGVRGRLIVAGTVALLFMILATVLAVLPSLVIEHWLMDALSGYVTDLAGMLITCILFVAYLDRRRAEAQAMVAASATTG